MKIAYLNTKPKPKADPNSEVLEMAYMKDIRNEWNKRKEALEKLGIKEREYVAHMRSLLLI